MMLIVVPPKGIDLLLRVLERREPVHVQTVFAKPSVERLDHRVVRRLAPATEVEDHAVGIRPEIHRGTDELRAVVAVDPLGQPPIEPEALECRGDVLPCERASHGNVQTLPRVEIQNRQRPESPAVGQLVRDEVHACMFDAAG